MAMKLLGLGFSFSGKDKGAKKTAESLADSIGSIDEGIKSINTSARMSKLSAFIQSVSLHKLGQISDKLGDMAARAGSPELQTGLEKTFFQMNRTTSTTVAALGLSAVAARKAQKDWARWAYQMGVGVETVQEIGVASIQTGLDLKEYGLTVKDLVKLQEAYGVSGRELVGAFKQLETTYNVTGKQAKGITDAIVAQGRALGFGKEALAGLPEMTMRINKMFAQTFRREGPEDFKKTALGIMKLSSVMSKQLGVSFEQGRESAMAIFEQLSGAEVGFQKMAAGLESSMPGITEAMAAVGFDIRSIFDQIRQDPVEFAQSMRRSLKAMRAMGGRESQMALMFTQRLHAVMGELPDEFRQLMDASGEAGEQIDKMLAGTNSPVARAEGTLNRLAGAWKAPFDLDEVLSRARERLATTLSGISKKETSQFVRVQRKAYDDIGSKIRELAQDKGPLGFLIRRFSLFRKVGLAALFPMSDKGLGRNLGALAPLFASVASKSLPFLTAMGSLGMRPGHIVKPFTMMLKPLGLMHKMIPGIGKSFLRVFGPIGLIVTLVGAFGKDLKEAFADVWEKAARFVGATLPKFLLKHVFGSKIDPKAPLWTQVGQKVLAGLTSAWEWTVENFAAGVKIFGGILHKAGNWLSEQPWDKYMGDVVSWLGDAFLWIGKTVWRTAIGIWDWIWGDETKQVVGQKIGRMEGSAGQIISDGFVRMIEGLWGAIKKAISGLWGRFIGFWSDESTSFLGKLQKFGEGMMGVLATGLILSGGFRRKVFGSFKSLFGGIFRRTKAGALQVCAQAAMGQQCMAGMAGNVAPPTRLRAMRTQGSAWTRSMRFQQKAAALGYGGTRRPGPLAAMRIRAGMLREDIAAIPNRMAVGFRNAARSARDFAKSIPRRGLNALRKGWQAAGRGIQSVTSGIRNFGRLAGGAASMLVMAGALDPLIEKFAKTETAIRTTQNALQYGLMGYMAGGPMGMAVGAAVGFIGTLVSKTSELGVTVSNVTDKISGMVGALIGPKAALIDWRTEAKKNADFAKSMTQSGFLLAGEQLLVGLGLKGRATLKESYDELHKANVEVVYDSRKSMVSLLKMFNDTSFGVRKINSMTAEEQKEFTRKLTESMNINMVESAKVIESAATTYELYANKTGKVAEEQRKKAVRALGQQLEMLLEYEKFMSENFPEVYAKTGRTIDELQGRIESLQKRFKGVETVDVKTLMALEQTLKTAKFMSDEWMKAQEEWEKLTGFTFESYQYQKSIGAVENITDAIRKFGEGMAGLEKPMKALDPKLLRKNLVDLSDAGERVNREAFQQSWGTDLIEGFSAIGSAAREAAGNMEVLRAVASRSVAARMPAFGGAAGGGGGNGPSAASGTGMLIQVLQAGFNAMVSAVDRNTAESARARSQITLRVARKGAGQAESYALAYQ